jgi:uncharacterized membrane protein
MSTRTTLLIAFALIVIGAVFGAGVYSRLPDPMVTHWGFNGQVNGTMPRIWGDFLLPALSLVLLGVFLLIPRIDPLKANITQFRESFNAFIVLIIAFLLYVHVLTVVWNLGYQSFQMSSAILPGVGVLFIFAGIILRKTKRNFFIGIRTPWTLSSDRVWDETHRVGSWTFIALGIVTLFTGLLGTAGLWVMLAALFIAVLIPVVYSYFLYQQETGA